MLSTAIDTQTAVECSGTNQATGQSRRVPEIILHAFYRPVTTSTLYAGHLLISST
jgi:hypothetical protein